MNASIILDFLVLKCNGTTLYFDDRTVSKGLLLEVLLRGFQVINSNPTYKVTYGDGYLGLICFGGGSSASNGDNQGNDGFDFSQLQIGYGMSSGRGKLLSVSFIYSGGESAETSISNRESDTCQDAFYLF